MVRVPVTCEQFTRNVKSNLFTFFFPVRTGNTQLSAVLEKEGGRKKRVGGRADALIPQEGGLFIKRKSSERKKGGGFLLT